MWKKIIKAAVFSLGGRNWANSSRWRPAPFVYYVLFLNVDISHHRALDLRSTFLPFNSSSLFIHFHSLCIYLYFGFRFQSTPLPFLLRHLPPSLGLEHRSKSGIERKREFWKREREREALSSLAGAVVEHHRHEPRKHETSTQSSSAKRGRERQDKERKRVRKETRAVKRVWRRRRRKVREVAGKSKRRDRCADVSKLMP